MYIIEKQAAYNIEEATEICSLSEDTVHAEVLNWFSCSVGEWNSWYEKYSEGEFNIDMISWEVLRFYALSGSSLQDLAVELESYHSTVSVDTVDEVYEELMQHVPSELEELYENAQASIKLSLLQNLSYTLKSYFSDAPYSAHDNKFLLIE